MRKSKDLKLCLLSLVLVNALLTTKVEGFDSKAISQVSKAIAECKLMGEDEGETKAEPQIYMSNALRGKLEKGVAGEVTNGLSAFSQNQVDPIIWWDPQFQVLKDIQIYQVHDLYKFNPNAVGMAPPNIKEVYISPNKMGPSTILPNDPDSTIAHELGHKQFENFYKQLPLEKRMKIDYRKVSESFAIFREVDFDMKRRGRFNVENKIAADMKKEGYNVKAYNSYDEYINIYKGRWNKTLQNIPSKTSSQINSQVQSISPHTFYKVGIGINSYSFGAGNISHSPKLPSTPYALSIPKIPTYTSPQIPSSGPNINFRR